MSSLEQSFLEMSTARVHRTLAVVCICAATAAGAGCASGGGPRAARVAASIEAGSPGCDLERESHFSLGGVSLSLIRTLARWVGVIDEVQALEMIQRVEIATYRIPLRSSCHDLSRLGEVEDELGRDGWWTIARERDGMESSWVFGRGDREGALDGLFVITLSDGELEVVRLEGQIEKIIAQAVAADPSEAARLAGSG